MKQYRSLIVKTVIIILITASFASCMNCIEGEGPLTVENRSTVPYSELEVNIAGDVTIHPGEDLQIRINAQENLMKVITTRVKEKTLVIGSDRCIRSSDRIKINLTVPTLSSIKLNGSGSIVTRSFLNTDRLDLAINGSGTVAIDVYAIEVEVGINGSGETILNGSAENIEVEINGSGDYRGLGLETEDAQVTIRGSGDVYINAKNSLKAEILGSGDIIYAGNPSVDSSVKGSGSVSKKR